MLSTYDFEADSMVIIHDSNVAAAISAYCIEESMPIGIPVRNRDGVLMFMFENTPELVEALDYFDADELKVAARTYYDFMEEINSLIAPLAFGDGHVISQKDRS